MLRSQARALMVSVCLGIGTSYAAPDIKILWGIEKVTKENKESFNPINARIALDIDYLKNIRYFGNNGPKENEDFHCIAKGRGNNKPNKCPQDYVTALIQWLFPDYQENRNFSPNDRINNKDFVASLTPEIVGKILNKISEAEDKKTEEGLTEAIYRIILDTAGNQFLKDNQKMLTKLQEGLDKISFEKTDQALVEYKNLEKRVKAQAEILGWGSDYQAKFEALETVERQSKNIEKIKPRVNKEKEKELNAKIAALKLKLKEEKGPVLK